MKHLYIFLLFFSFTAAKGQTFNECMEAPEIYYYNAFTCDSLTVMVYSYPDNSECFNSGFNFQNIYYQFVWMGRHPSQEDFFPLSPIYDHFAEPLTVHPGEYEGGFVDVHICIRAKYNTYYHTNWYKSNHLPCYFEECEEVPPCTQDSIEYNITYIDSTITNLTYIDSTFITVNYQDSIVWTFLDSIMWSITDSVIVNYQDSLVINYQDTTIVNTVIQTDTTYLEIIDTTFEEVLQEVFLDSLIVLYDTTYQEVTVIDGQEVNLDSLLEANAQIIYDIELDTIDICNQFQIIDQYDVPLCQITVHPNPSPNGQFSFELNSERPLGKVTYWVTDSFGSSYLWREEAANGSNYLGATFYVNSQIAQTYFLHIRIDFADGTQRTVLKQLLIQ